MTSVTNSKVFKPFTRPVVIKSFLTSAAKALSDAIFAFASTKFGCG